MPLTLTCDCGARFEVEDLLAGQTVPCPECQHPHLAPGKPSAAGPRTSLLALLSLLLALSGAFTLVGGAAAALLGLFALLDIRRRPAQLTGAPFALAGTILGPVLALLTLAGLLRADDLPFDGWLRAWAMAGQLEPLPSQQVLAPNGECVFTVSSPGWRKVRGQKTAHPIVGELQQKCDLLLFEPRRYAFLDLTRVGAGAAPDGAGLSAWMAEELSRPRPPLIGAADDDPSDLAANAGPAPTIGAPTELPALDGLEVEERAVFIRRGTSGWRFLVRTYRKPLAPGARPSSPLWVIRAYAPARRFDAVEAELRAALDSVRFSP